LKKVNLNVSSNMRRCQSASSANVWAKEKGEKEEKE